MRKDSRRSRQAHRPGHTTRARGRQSGTEIRVNGGTISSVVEAASAEGSSVQGNQPFHDLPEFAAWVSRLADYALREVRAIHGVLPESTLNLDAPGQTGGVS